MADDLNAEVLRHAVLERVANSNQFILKIDNRFASEECRTFTGWQSVLDYFSLPDKNRPQATIWQLSCLPDNSVAYVYFAFGAMNLYHTEADLFYDIAKGTVNGAFSIKQFNGHGQAGVTHYQQSWSLLSGYRYSTERVKHSLREYFTQGLQLFTAVLGFSSQLRWRFNATVAGMAALTVAEAQSIERCPDYICFDQENSFVSDPLVAAANGDEIIFSTSYFNQELALRNEVLVEMDALAEITRMQTVRVLEGVVPTGKVTIQASEILPDGDKYLAGAHGASTNKAFVARLSQNNTVLFANLYDFYSADVQGIHGLQQGAYLRMRTFLSTTPTPDSAVIKIDSTGMVQWGRYFSNTRLLGSALAPNEELCLLGRANYELPGFGDSRSLLFKLNQNGLFSWAKVIDQVSDSSSLWHLLAFNADQFILAASNFYARIDYNGTLIGAYSFQVDNRGFDSGPQLAVNSDSNSLWISGASNFRHYILQIINDELHHAAYFQLNTQNPGPMVDSLLYQNDSLILFGRDRVTSVHRGGHFLKIESDIKQSSCVDLIDSVSAIQYSAVSGSLLDLSDSLIANSVVVPVALPRELRLQQHDFVTPCLANSESTELPSDERPGESFCINKICQIDQSVSQLEFVDAHAVTEGRVVLIANTHQGQNPFRNSFIVKHDIIGSTLWAKKIDNANPRSIAANNKGGSWVLYAKGSDSTYHFRDIHLLELSDAGEALHTRLIQIEGSAQRLRSNGQKIDIQVSLDHTFAPVLFSLSSTFDASWVSQLTSTLGAVTLGDFASLQQGGIAGVASISQSPDTTAVCFKIDVQGQVLWVYQLDPDITMAYALNELPNQDLLVVVRFSSDNQHDRRGILLLSHEGHLISTHTIRFDDVTIQDVPAVYPVDNERTLVSVNLASNQLLINELSQVESRINWATIFEVDEQESGSRRIERLLINEDTSISAYMTRTSTTSEVYDVRLRPDGTLNNCEDWNRAPMTSGHRSISQGAPLQSHFALATFSSFSIQEAATTELEDIMNLCARNLTGALINSRKQPSSSNLALILGVSFAGLSCCLLIVGGGFALSRHQRRRLRAENYELMLRGEMTHERGAQLLVKLTEDFPVCDDVRYRLIMQVDEVLAMLIRNETGYQFDLNGCDSISAVIWSKATGEQSCFVYDVIDKELLLGKVIVDANEQQSVLNFYQKLASIEDSGKQSVFDMRHFAHLSSSQLSVASSACMISISSYANIGNGTALQNTVNELNDPGTKRQLTVYMALQLIKALCFLQNHQLSHNEISLLSISASLSPNMAQPTDCRIQLRDSSQLSMAGNGNAPLSKDRNDMAEVINELVALDSYPESSSQLENLCQELRQSTDDRIVHALQRHGLFEQNRMRDAEKQTVIKVLKSQLHALESSSLPALVGNQGYR